MAGAYRSRPPARSFTTAPTIEEIEEIAGEALASIPEDFRRHTANVHIHVDDFPSEEVEKTMELESPFDILGLYRGGAIAGREGSNPSPYPDMIHLYRRPILDYWCETGEELGHVVRHVLIHEIGHHFGFSDDDMEALEKQVPD